MNKTIFSVWIAECFSCQSDLIQHIKQCITTEGIRVYSSHSKIRPELDDLSDHHLQQPEIELSAAWLLQQCIEHQIDLLFCGKDPMHIEALREQFELHHIQLVTGAIGLLNHANIEDKFEFAQLCAAQQLPSIPSIKVSNASELMAAIELLKATDPHNICVKPVVGVFGAGFLQLQDDLSYFEHFQNPWLCNTQQFIDAYASHPVQDYLVMPFLSGLECSVDIACSRGVVIKQVTRIKHDVYQQCLLDGPCHDIATQLVALFHCDGMINIQFKQDAHGKWYILEINQRPAGGFAYTQHTGINLVSALLCEKLNIESTASTVLKNDVWIRPVTTTVAVTF